MDTNHCRLYFEGHGNKKQNYQFWLVNHVDNVKPLYAKITSDLGTDLGTKLIPPYQDDSMGLKFKLVSTSAKPEKFTVAIYTDYNSNTLLEKHTVAFSRDTPPVAVSHDPVVGVDYGTNTESGKWGDRSKTDNSDKDWYKSL